MAKQKVRSAEDKKGGVRAAFDHDAALEALAWAKGGQQLELLPGRALRLVGASPAPDDAEPGKVGRPPGARSTAPQAWREYLTATYGSVIEGLVRTGTAPLAAIAAELIQAYHAVYEAVHAGQHTAGPPPISAAQILELITTAAQMRLTAQRYAAPYQHSQAPQPVEASSPVRAAIALFVGGAGAGGQVSPQVESQASSLLTQLLSGTQENQRVSDAEIVDVNAADLNATRAAAPETGGE